MHGGGQGRAHLKLRYCVGRDRVEGDEDGELPRGASIAEGVRENESTYEQTPWLETRKGFALAVGDCERRGYVDMQRRRLPTWEIRVAEEKLIRDGQPGFARRRREKRRGVGQHTVA